MPTCGAIKSPIDNRDFAIKSINISNAESIPVNLDLREKLLPVRDQGEQGSCVAFAISDIQFYHNCRDAGLDRYLSPQYMYNLRSVPDGMIVRNALKLAQKYGLCLEQEFVYGKDTETREDVSKYPFELRISAKRFVIDTYVKLSEIEPDLMKKAFVRHGPCMIVVPVYNYGTTMWKPERFGQKIISGHAMVIVGYDDTGFIIRNSWGTSWGDNGYTKMTYDAFRPANVWEVWCLTDKSGTLYYKPSTIDGKVEKIKKLFNCVKPCDV